METILKPTPPNGTGRRDFLKWTGGSLLAGGLLLESCKKKSDDTPTPTPTPTPTYDGLTLQNSDIGILNYAYALEQLEADFYDKVVTNAAFSAQFSTGEQALFKDIAAHEKAHRDFFMAAIPADSRLKTLTFKYTGMVDFTNRASILAAAQNFEDLGVSAYNGAGPKITDPSYLVLAGKIVSVEARHAAFIRELRGVARFVDTDVATVDYTKLTTISTLKSPIKPALDTDPQPLTISELGFSATNNAIEKAKAPADVLPSAQAFINETLKSELV